MEGIGGKIETTPEKEGRLSKNSQWDQAFYVFVPDESVMTFFSCLIKDWNNLGINLSFTQGTMYVLVLAT